MAGRMYYEAHAFGYLLNSFTSSGFIDRLGYEQPFLRSTKLMALEKFYSENQIPVLSMLTLGVVILFYLCYKKINADQEDENIDIKYKKN